MKPKLKTAEQIEFAELFDQLKEMGLNKAAVGRALNLRSRGYVGMVLQGTRQPAPRTLSDMRKLAASYQSEAEHGKKICQANEADELYKHLRYLERADKPKFDVAKTMIGSLLPPDYKKTKRPSSGAKRKKTSDSSDKFLEILQAEDDPAPTVRPEPAKEHPARRGV